VIPLGWSVPVPCLNWIRLTVPKLGRLQAAIKRRFPSPIAMQTESTWKPFSVASYGGGVDNHIASQV